MFGAARSPKKGAGGFLEEMVRLVFLAGLAALLINCNPAGSGQTSSDATGWSEVIAHGEVVDLAPHISTGRVTVFDFYADWCAPCKHLDRSLADMKAVYGDRLVIFKLDLVSWESALAEHFQIRDLPYLMVYDRQGELMGQGPSNQLMPRLVTLLNQ